MIRENNEIQGKRPVKPLGYVNFTKLIFEINWKLVSGDVRKLSLNVVKREFNSRHYNVMHCLL